MRVEVTLPSVLRDCVGPEPRTRFAIEGIETFTQALRALQQRYPLLRAHVWDDAGRLRPHGLIFHNDQGIRGMPSLDVPLREGDRIHIVQAVSGG